MSNRNRYLPSVSYCLSAAVLLATTATVAWAWKNPMEHRFTTAPLDVCDQGAFYVGGVPKVSNYVTSALAAGPPQQIIIGSMYVNFQIPKKRRQWPLIMVHGGGYTGSSVQSTPHNTEGWDTYAVRNNLATFVVDQAGRGRSGFDNTGIHEAKATNNVSLIPDTIRATSSNGIFTGWFGHLIPAGTNILTGTLIQHGDPGDPLCASEPEHCTYHPAYALDQVDPNIEARLGALGPAPNPANNHYLALETYKWGVPNTEHTLPGSTCSACDPTTLSGQNTWTPPALAELVIGLGGAIVATHSQSGIHGHHLVRVLKEKGELDKLKGLITIEGSCSLTNSGTTAADYVNIPYLAFKGDYTNTSAICEQTVAAIQAAGGTAEYIKLDDPEYGDTFNGVTHMMMLGTGNLEVFDVMLEWAEENIANPIVETSCPSGPPDVPPGLSKKPGGLPPGQAKKL
jgi:hypothetical protein